MLQLQSADLHASPLRSHQLFPEFSGCCPAFLLEYLVEIIIIRKPGLDGNLLNG
ncbi:hypothetical protein D3C87_2164120 [compost metagenome]